MSQKWPILAWVGCNTITQQVFCAVFLSLDNESELSLKQSPQNLHTCSIWGQALKQIFKNFFPLKIICHGKTSNNLPCQCDSGTAGITTGMDRLVEAYFYAMVSISCSAFFTLSWASLWPYVTHASIPIFCSCTCTEESLATFGIVSGDSCLGIFMLDGYLFNHHRVYVAHCLQPV